MRHRATGVLVAVCLAASGATLVMVRRQTPPAEAVERAAAVVLDPRGNPCIDLPPLDELLSDPQAAAASLRSKGVVVATDPHGQCLAVASTPQLEGEAVDLSRMGLPLLAAYMLHHTTSEQLATRERAFFPPETLSGPQRLALDAMGRRGGLVDADGRPRLAGGRLALGLWQSWDVHVCLHTDSGVIRQRLYVSSEPPTPEAIVAPPLAGSALWWASAHAEASWGNETASLDPSTYALGQVLEELSRASGLSIAAPVELEAREVAVAAENTRVSTLVWALEIALGLRCSVRQEPDGAGLRLQFLPDMDIARDYDNLRPIARGVYYSPRASAVSVELLPRLQEVPTDTFWIGWRLADLPLLYRNLATDGFEKSFRFFRNAEPPPLDPDRTFVLWTKAVVLAVELRDSPAGGTGAEFTLPAL